jgi:hypothetical protein
MRKELWILICAVGVGVTLTLGSLQLFATKGELSEVAVSSKCGQVEYQIDKVNRSIWEVEDRYINPDGSRRTPMAPYDAKRMRELLQQLKGWQDKQKGLGCIPGKVG